MTRIAHKVHARKRRPKLSIEQLERRDLMAGDTSTVDPALLSEPVDTATIQTSSDFDGGRDGGGGGHHDDYRSIDGTGNNLANPELGSTGEQLVRVAPNDYADGISAPGGEDRPGAREISNAIAAQEEDTNDERGLSAYIYIFGQFLDHDIDLTEPPGENQESFNIEVPAGDEFFDPDGSGDEVIPLTRSRYDTDTGTSVDNPRQQINQITAFIDGSQIYGSDQATADSLRTFQGGRLRTSAGNLPPVDANGNFVAGDVRANENIELTSMHSLFIREHNYWANKIARDNRGLSDEEIYQRARAIVGAELQVIVYEEYLPALLGPGALSRYDGYDPTVNPGIANEFSTASFRFHSFINNDVEFFGNDGRPVREEIELAEAFMNPDLLRETGIDSILKYGASATAEQFDNTIVDGLRNFLFGEPGQGGLDLASLNIQRGRDHGLADYNSVREAYGLARVTSFAEITSDAELQQTLEEIYGSVDNIDLWVGGLAEDHVPGGSVGETIRAVVADQYERLRDGDRYWYERVFSGDMLDRIERTNLSDIIERNTTVSNLQNDVFFMRAEVSGEVFNDRDRDGREDRDEDGIRGITVELLDDEGEVIATTVTDRNGRYRFVNQFRETGDYQIRILVPTGYKATTSVVRDVLISRGDIDRDNVDFGLRRDWSSTNADAVDEALALDADPESLA